MIALFCIVLLLVVIFLIYIKPLKHINHISNNIIKNVPEEFETLEESKCKIKATARNIKLLPLLIAII